MMFIFLFYVSYLYLVPLARRFPFWVPRGDCRNLSPSLAVLQIQGNLEMTWVHFHLYIFHIFVGKGSEAEGAWRDGGHNIFHAHL